jgi:TonB family protein
MTRLGCIPNCPLRAAAFFGSLLLHTGAVAALGRQTVTTHAARPVSTVVFEVNEPPAPKPPPPAPKPDTPAPPREAAPAAARAPTPAPITPAASPNPRAATEEPVDLTGVTLTANGDGPGWAAPVGNGEARTGLARSARAAQPRPAPAHVEPSKPAPPSWVPVASLSRKPVPPALDGALAAHYPADARRAGRSGAAVVIARIDADGLVREVSVASESGPGFGAACAATVRGSRWAPPLDGSGRPVATRVSYTCRFQVES